MLFNGQSAQYHSGIAYYIPIRFTFRPRIRISGFIFLNDKIQCLCFNRMNNQLSGRRGQYIVQPVVTNGYSRRHFRHIQVMNRVPVREIANMNQLSLRLLRKTSVSTQSVGQSQVDHPVNLFTADRQYVFRVFYFSSRIFLGRNRQQTFSLPHQAGAQTI